MGCLVVLRSHGALVGEKDILDGHEVTTLVAVDVVVGHKSRCLLSTPDEGLASVNSDLGRDLSEVSGRVLVECVETDSVLSGDLPSVNNVELEDIGGDCSSGGELGEGSIGRGEQSESGTVDGGSQTGGIKGTKKGVELALGFEGLGQRGHGELCLQWGKRGEREES